MKSSFCFDWRRRPGLFRTAGALSMILLGGNALGQVPNDECTGATVVDGIPYFDSVDTTQATSNPSDPSLSCNAG